MKRPWPFHAFVVLCALVVRTAVFCQQDRVTLASATRNLDGSKPLSDTSAFLSDEPNIPDRMLDTMRNSQARYLEG